MIVESFLKDKERVRQLNSALSILHQIGAFGVFLEISAQRSVPTPSNLPIENAALRASWQNGYFECLKDIFEFNDRYNIQAKSPTRPPDFGAAAELLKNGEITPEEYARLTTSSE